MQKVGEEIMTPSDSLRPNPMDVAVTGTVELYRGAKRATWYARWRDHTGQHRRRLGPAWERKGPPDPGYCREREARGALQAILTDARRGATQQGRTGLTFAALAEEWLAAGVLQRDWSHNTEVDYRSVLRRHLLPAFGELRVESVSASRIEAWRNALVRERGLSRRNVNKIHATLHGVLEYAREHHELRENPAARVRKLRESYDAAHFEFFSPEEIAALAAHAANRQDAAIYTTAAFTGLRRGELIALRWGEVDFANRSIRVLEGYTRKRQGRTKSRRSRTVPMVDEVAAVLAAVRDASDRAGAKSLVFPGEDGTYLDGSALRRRYIAARDGAGIRPLRSMTCATPSARWRSTARRSCRCRRGWVTPTSRRSCAICTTEATPTRPTCWRVPSASGFAGYGLGRRARRGPHRALNPG